MNIFDFGKIAVIYGGESPERDVSLESGAAILNALVGMGADVVGVDLLGVELIDTLRDRKIDYCFIALHGPGGEDGTLQGMLSSMNIPYTGSHTAASAFGMDKVASKCIWQAMKLLTPKFIILDDTLNTSSLRFPLAIKPTNQGSSIGIHKVKRIESLEDAYNHAKQYGAVMAEEWIEGIELSVPIIGTEVLPSIRIESAAEFYDYNSKYINNSSYYCPSGIGEQYEKKIRELAYIAFNSLGCKGWARVDFLMDSNYNFYLLEVNTVPGMTEKSLVPKSAKVKGWSYQELILNILKSSYND